MDVNFSEALKAVGGRTRGHWQEQARIAGVSTDTRHLKEGDLFFALQGPHFDGHDFIAQALEKGAAGIVLSRPQAIPEKASAKTGWIEVSDTLKAYGDLARFYRRKFSVPAVAITGSCGKTTVKELTAHLLSARFNVLKNQGTENNLVGVPKTLFRLDGSQDVIVLEMGTNQPGEIDRLADILGPQAGMLTQIGHSHLEGLKSLEGVRREKLSFVPRVEKGGWVLLNGEDPMQKDVSDAARVIERVGFSKETGDFFAEEVRSETNGSSFLWQGKTLFRTPLIGRHNVLNTLFAIAAAMKWGLTPAEIQSRLNEFKPVAGRLQVRPVEGILFIDDTYNSNPHSFKAALETLAGFKNKGRKGVLCADMLEMGEEAVSMHRQMGAFIAGLGLDFLVAVGPLSAHLAEEAKLKGMDPRRIHSAADSEEAGKWCRKIANEGDAVLVKGSRGMHMEKVFECFITSSTR